MPWLTPDEVDIQVVRWLADPESWVTVDQDLMELLVDGETFFLPSPLEGKLQDFQVEPGDFVVTDQTLAVIEID